MGVAIASVIDTIWPDSTVDASIKILTVITAAAVRYFTELDTETSTNAHKQSSTSFMLMYNNVLLTILQAPRQRPNGVQFTQALVEEYQTLIGSMPTIPQHIVDLGAVHRNSSNTAQPLVTGNISVIDVRRNNDSPGTSSSEPPHTRMDRSGASFHQNPLSGVQRMFRKYPTTPSHALPSLPASRVSMTPPPEIPNFQSFGMQGPSVSFNPSPSIPRREEEPPPLLHDEDPGTPSDNMMDP